MQIKGVNTFNLIHLHFDFDYRPTDNLEGTGVALPHYRILMPNRVYSILQSYITWMAREDLAVTTNVTSQRMNNCKIIIFSEPQHCVSWICYLLYLSVCLWIYGSIYKCLLNDLPLVKKFCFLLLIGLQICCKAWCSQPFILNWFIASGHQGANFEIFDDGLLNSMQFYPILMF